jgi:hypothetical protein
VASITSLPSSRFSSCSPLIPRPTTTLLPKSILIILVGGKGH